MLLLFNLFYRQFGIRRIQQLLTPKLFNFNSFPRNTLFHFVSDNPEIHDLDTSKLYFANYNKRILVDYPNTLSSNLGTPRKLAVLIKDQFRKFHIVNKKFKYQIDHYKTTNDQQTLLVNNYSYLDVQYKYIDFPLTAYYKFKNKYNTIFSTMNDLVEKTDRSNFIFIDIPDEFPGYAIFNVYEKLTNISMLKLFNTDNKLFLLELWRWLSKENNKETIFSNIKPTNLGKVNIVFNAKDGRSALLNLGYLHSWIKGNDNLTEFNSVPQFNNIIIQKLVLKFFLTLQSIFPEETTEEQVNTETESNIQNNNAVTTDEDKLLQEEEEEVNDEVNGNETQINQNEFYSYAKPEKPDQVIKADIDTEGEYNTLANTDINDVILDIDKELQTLDALTNNKLKNKGLKVNESGDITEIKIIDDSNVNVEDVIYKDKSNEEALIEIIDKNSEFNIITASDYKKLTAEVINYGKKKDPYNTNLSIAEKINITADDIKISQEKSTMVVSDLVQDKSMTQSTLNSFDKDYINNVMQKDMISMISHIQRTGVVIKNHEIEKDNSILGEYEIHTLKLKPIDGAESTIRFRLPVVNEDGTFKANGNKYVTRKQRIDLPIRKIAPDIVALTSYFGKTFISTSQKKAGSSIEWIFRQIEKLSITDDSNIKKLGPANVYDNNFNAPYIYNAIAKKYKVIETDKYNLIFDKNERYHLFEEAFIKSLEEDKYILTGRTKGNFPIFVDFNNVFYIFKQNTLVEIGDIYAVLELNALKAPVDFTEMRVFNKTMTVGFILAYYLGMNNLIKFLKCNVRVLDSNRNKNLESHEYSLRFKDKILVFTRKEKLNSLILGGLLEYEDVIKNFDYNEFNNKDVYYSLLEAKGLTSIYIRELELTNEMFVDPITKSILESMNEPTTFKGLLMRSSEMLLNYNHPDSQDTAYQRIRGYERFSGVVYKELVSSIRQFRNKNISGKSKIEMSPFQIWQTVMKDAANKIVEDINPIQNLKEIETVTYVGEGGRGKESMNRASRAFHINDVAVMSEATVGSADVGINSYLSANPEFSNLRGVINKDKQLNAATILSTSALLAPGSTNDDGKRVNFVNIQQSHTIATNSYTQPVVKTGYEYVIANRTSEMFAYSAKKDGVIKSVNAKGIVIEYEDKTIKGLPLGRLYGKAEGSVYPHDVITTFKEGDKVKKGDVITYNKNFFEQDYLDPTKIVLKNSLIVKTAFLESSQTLDDSSSISKKLSDKLRSKTTKIKSLTVNFNQRLNNMVQVGNKVKPKDILVIIEDELTSNTDDFNEESLATLKKLSNQAPLAKYEGVIDRIEVFYNGDKEDMSNSLRLIADASDKMLVQECKATNKSVITGQVTDEYRVAGIPLGIDKAEIKIYITVETKAAVGDKGVFANQMKSVFGEVMDYSVTTETGDEVDAIFGFKSILNRIVTSPLVIGTTTTLLDIIGKQAVKLYER